MKQYVYDVLLISISHLFIIMILENILLFTYLEKHFASGISKHIKTIFDEMQKIASISTDKLIKNEDKDIKNNNLVETLVDNSLTPTYKLIKDEDKFTKELQKYSKKDIKNNNLVVKLVLLIVNILVLLILLYLIYYGRKSTNNIKLNIKYLMYSCISSLIIIGIVDGIFLSNLPIKVFNIYDLQKDFIDYILD